MSASSRHVYLPATSPRLDEIIRALAQRFPDARFAPRSSAVEITFGEWTMRMVDFRESWVADEARELVSRAPDEARKALSAATHRLEIYDSGDAESDDDHYNDALLVWEYCTQFVEGAVGLDPVSGSFYMPAPRKKTAAKRTSAPKKKAAPKKPAKKSAKKKPAAKKKAAKKKAAKK
jgi:hypothetical protein